MTIYKPHNTNINNLIIGVYFKSDSDITTQYLIKARKEKDNKGVVEIFNTDILTNHFDIKEINIGDTIALPEYAIQKIVTIELWGKYFFPTIKNGLRMHYDHEQYYGGDSKTNIITSLMEAINYGIAYGLKQCNIKLY